MPEIIIKGETKFDNDVRLYNGDIIITKYGGKFIVSSYVANNGSCDTKYCSLINLENFQRAFQEPCSRRTTLARIANHFKHSREILPWDIQVIGTKSYSLTIDMGEVTSEDQEATISGETREDYKIQPRGLFGLPLKPWTYHKVRICLNSTNPAHKSILITGPGVHTSSLVTVVNKTYDEPITRQICNFHHVRVLTYIDGMD